MTIKSPEKPIVLIRPRDGKPPSGLPMSSIGYEIKNSDGSDIPLMFTKAIISIDWASGDPVTVMLEAISGFGVVDVSAIVESIVISGKRYRLVREE